MFNFIYLTAKEDEIPVILNIDSIISAKEYEGGTALVLRDDKYLVVKDTFDEVIHKIDATGNDVFNLFMWYWNNKKEK